MGKRRRRPSFGREHYERWKAETPKVLDDSLTLEAPDPAVRDGHWMSAKEVHPGCLEDIIESPIFVLAVPNDAGQFRIKVVPDDGVTDFLLMAHIDHHAGDFDADGKRHGPDQPHFHEWQWFPPDPRGRNTTRVPGDIEGWTDIWPADLMGAFSHHYGLQDEDGRADVAVEKGAPPAATQRSLEKWFH